MAKTDIRILSTLFGHRKAKRLMLKHGADGVIALLKLWLYAASHKPKGDLTGMSAEDIAIEIDWTGDPDLFLRDLIAIKWVDGDPKNGIRLHDWEEHQPYVFKAPERSAVAKRNAEKRWRGVHGVKDELEESGDAGSIASGANGNADSDISNARPAKSNAPSPSPGPAPSTIPLPPEDSVAAIDRFNKWVGETKNLKSIQEMAKLLRRDPEYSSETDRWLVAEVAKMRAWLIGNPARGPKNRFGRFVSSWLNRTAESGPAATERPYDNYMSKKEETAYYARKRLAGESRADSEPTSIGSILKGQ